MLWVTTSISSLYGSIDLSILLHPAMECLPTSQYVWRLHVQPTASLKRSLAQEESGQNNTSEYE